MNLSLNNKIQSFINNDEISQELIKLCAQKNGVQLYIVGGYVRDIILDIPTVDRDYVVVGQSGISFAQEACDYFDGHFILLDEENQIARVVLQDKVTVLDFASCLNDDILEDLSRRDFTVNAMAYGLDQKDESNLLDPFNGLVDLKNKIIRTISEKNIIDDPLRILRAYRFAAFLSSTIEDKTNEYIKKHYLLLENVSMERIQTELNKLFLREHSFPYVKMMSEVGILDFLIPELKELYKVPPNVYHHLGLYEHTLEVYRQLEEIIPKQSDRVKEHLNEYISASIQRVVVLKYAALLHDIAKPKTWKIDEDGKHSFIGHADDGAEIAEQILKRLKNPNILCKIAAKLIKYHLYPSQLSSKDEMPTVKAMQRFFRKLDKETPEAILLALADRNSALGPLITHKDVQDLENMLYSLLDQYYINLEKTESLPPLLNGHEVMQILNIKPSLLVGSALKEIRSLQLEGILLTAEDAKDWLKNKFNS